MRAYVSTVFGCPYEGEVESGCRCRSCDEITADWVFIKFRWGIRFGVANPVQVDKVLVQVLAKLSIESIAVHFHDTQGTALANCMVALALGITTIDSSIGGLGGCPYAPGAAGNLATEDLVAMLQWDRESIPGLTLKNWSNVHDSLHRLLGMSCRPNICGRISASKRENAGFLKKGGGAYERRGSR